MDKILLTYFITITTTTTTTNNVAITSSSCCVFITALAHNSPAYLHRLIEALKLAFADAHQYVTDPELVSVPVEGMLSKQRAAVRRQLVNPDR